MIEIYKPELAKRGFNLIDKIGSGLSGSTIKAEQKSLKRMVAVKFFDSDFNKNNHYLRSKFLKESHLLAEAQHPSIPYVITTGQIERKSRKIPYIVMQYISGQTLESFMEKNQDISLDKAIDISEQILIVLDFVHKKSILHRDIKPSNIMILPSGHCYLIDFSIGVKFSENEFSRETQTGAHLGSYKYMSPEQTEDMKSVDKRTDIYSYAIILCELLVGKPNLQELEASTHKCSRALIKVIKRAANVNPENRYPTASAFLQDLKEVLSSPRLFHETPRKAICSNLKCSSANWSPNGFYKGASFKEESIATHCTDCGNALIYQCEKCTSSIDNTRFCGGCGTEQFHIPECRKCGSFLKKIDMDKKTELDGCERCNLEEAALQAQKPPKPKTPISWDDLDDDIPF